MGFGEQLAELVLPRFPPLLGKRLLTKDTEVAQFCLGDYWPEWLSRIFTGNSNPFFFPTASPLLSKGPQAFARWQPDSRKKESVFSALGLPHPFLSPDSHSLGCFCKSPHKGRNGAFSVPHQVSWPASCLLGIQFLSLISLSSKHMQKMQNCWVPNFALD